MDTKPQEKQTNWAGNYTYTATDWHSPETVEQVQEIVARSSRVKALGTRHSFNAIADTTADMISLAHFDQVLALDRERNTVTVGAGIRYGKLCQYLNREGYALHNLASLPHVSVAGACATGTHGSGVGNGCLSTAVSALDVVDGSGNLVRLSREQDGELFNGAVVGLGTLGIVTQLTLDISPAFTMRQEVYQNLPFSTLTNRFNEIMGQDYSVSCFTDWKTETVNQVWRKERVDTENVDAPQAEWYGAALADRDLHPIPGVSAESCTPQQGVPGAWYERLPHFRMEFTPSCGEELQSEYLLPREYAASALRAVQELREHIIPLLLISEIRTVAEDNLWLSPAYHQPSVAIHFTWKPDWPAVEKVLPRIEACLAPFHARPHWGKLFTMSSTELQPLYPRMPDFLDLQNDLQGKFRNEFLDSKLIGTHSP